MNQEVLWQEFVDLPPEAERQGMGFIVFLRSRYVAPHPRKARKPTKLAKESFIGMWRNRKNLQDSSTWVRGVRQGEWAKSRG